MKFLHTHNSRPHVAARIHGYHTERRTREVRRVDAEGNERWETEVFYVTVTDFDYRIDLTRFIFPFGYIDVSSKLSRCLEDAFFNDLSPFQFEGLR